MPITEEVFFFFKKAKKTSHTNDKIIYFYQHYKSHKDEKQKLSFKKFVMSQNILLT